MKSRSALYRHILNHRADRPRHRTTTLLRKATLFPKKIWQQISTHIKSDDKVIHRWSDQGLLSSILTQHNHHGTYLVLHEQKQHALEHHKNNPHDHIHHRHHPAPYAVQSISKADVAIIYDRMHTLCDYRQEQLLDLLSSSIPTVIIKDIDTSPDIPFLIHYLRRLFTSPRKKLCYQWSYYTKQQLENHGYQVVTHKVGKLFPHYLIIGKKPFLKF